MSRSSSLVIAYLIKHEGHSLASAFAAVKDKRRIIQPNPGFWAQLQEFEAEIRQ